MLNLASLNQRVNYLTGKINSIPNPPVADTLSAVLTAGNSAGAKDINMNNNDILAVDNINLTTINGSAYPPSVPVPTLDQVLASGNSSNLSVNLTGANYTIDLNATNGQYKAFQNTAPTFNTTIDVGQVATNAGASGFTTMTFGGITTNNTTQYVALQPTRLVATNDYLIETLTTGDISIDAKDTLNLKARDLAGTGKGISIDKTTPNIWYNLNTANANDRLTIDNNGTIEIVSVTNSLITSLSPNLIVLQHPAVSTALDIDCDLGLKFSTASASVNSSFSNSQLTFNGSATTSSYLNPTALNVSNTNQGTSVVNGGSASIIQASAGGTANPALLTLTNTNATGSVYNEIYKAKPSAGVNGEVLFTQSVYGKDSGNTKQEYTRITHTIRDVTAGAEDGSIEMGCYVNGTFTNLLQLNGNENEINMLKPLDMNGNNIRTTTGNMAINVASSTTAGATLTLATKDNVAGSGAGLLLTGNTLLSGSASGSSGQHLCLTIGGVVYKIALLNP